MTSRMNLESFNVQEYENSGHDVPLDLDKT